MPQSSNVVFKSSRFAWRFNSLALLLLFKNYMCHQAGGACQIMLGEEFPEMPAFTEYFTSLITDVPVSNCVSHRLIYFSQAFFSLPLLSSLTISLAQMVVLKQWYEVKTSSFLFLLFKPQINIFWLGSYWLHTSNVRMPVFEVCVFRGSFPCVENAMRNPFLLLLLNNSPQPL